MLGAAKTRASKKRLESNLINADMRQFFPQELDAILKSNGFRIEHKFGDFDQSDFTDKSPKQIIIARI